eukprot:IDg22839t1
MMIAQKGGPLLSDAIPAAPRKTGDRDPENEYFVNTRYLRGTVHCGEFGYPLTTVSDEFVLNWNRVFTTVPFFIPSNFVLGDIDALKVGHQAWHNPKEVPGSATDGRAFDKLRGYCDGNGVFPGK